MGWGVHDYPEPPEPKPYPVCPICGQDAAWFYINFYDRVVGCERCITMISDERLEDYL